MNLVLARVDERLIHGQVSVGWVPRLDVDGILIADGEAAADAWEADLFRSAAPPGVEVVVLNPRDAAERLRSEVPGRWLLLLRSLSSALDVVRAGGPVEDLNLGGLHFKDGARRYLDYVFLSRTDVDDIAALHGLGIRLTAQDLPGADAVDLNAAWLEGQLEFDKLSLRHS